MSGTNLDYLAGVQGLPQRLAWLLEANDGGRKLTSHEKGVLDRRLAEAKQRVFLARCRRDGLAADASPATWGSLNQRSSARASAVQSAGA